MHVLYAFALIGVAVISILSVKFRSYYLIAPAVAGATLSFGGAYLHVGEIVRTSRFVLARDGTELLFDVVVPVAVLCLAAAHGAIMRGQRVRAPD